MAVLLDIEVEVTKGRQANFESWLLGHGRLPKLSPVRLRGNSKRYVVKGVSERELSMVDKIGGKIVTRTISGD